MTDLTLLREQIQSLDAQILELAAERMKLCRQVGEYKRQKQLPIRDYKVEKQILEKTRQQASLLNIEPELAVALIKGLIKYSVLEQDQIKSNYQSLGTEDLKKVLVIGGSGNMGQWMTQFFEGLGHTVSIFDINTPSNNRFEVQSSLEVGLQWCDIAVLALPMDTTNSMLLELAKIQPDCLILEICSLKSPIAEGLSKAKSENLRVVSIHPMFGPDVRVLAGRNIVICGHPYECSDIQFVESLFKQTSANILRVHHDQHDAYMSVVLGSTHLLNILYADSLSNFGIEFNKLEQVAGTTFSKQIEVTKTVVNENADLYFDIQILNDESNKIINSLKKSINSIERDIKSNSRYDFVKKMHTSAAYFGNE